MSQVDEAIRAVHPRGWGRGIIREYLAYAMGDKPLTVADKHQIAAALRHCSDPGCLSTELFPAPPDVVPDTLLSTEQLQHLQQSQTPEQLQALQAQMEAEEAAEQQRQAEAALRAQEEAALVRAALRTVLEQIEGTPCPVNQPMRVKLGWKHRQSVADAVRRMVSSNRLDVLRRAQELLQEVCPTHLQALLHPA
ncbi:MAG: hypothetical protein GY807_08075 [Gammaproteobacteria bacterium]|nr:hypothetical protein [Gammaproteobacteria bacterium]